ncbi:LysR family transcriptional regulator [Inquilinus limosus]|uniref:LysR family transcriptional regulator n=1 Tax=Inquilinus limosus TaxID=171674 RepID=UPI00068CB258|nr:LysR family transcriptional regulator [Inquilinus limosus]
MDRLRLIRTFVAVANARSFTAAAEGLSLSRAAVTKQVAALEDMLRVQLLSRTTHSVNLTDAGAVLLEEGPRLLDDFEALELRMRSATARPAGTVRIGTPPSFGAYHVVPAIRAFGAVHPDIQVALTNDDGSLDIVRSGFDFSIRIAHSLRDASSISRLLMRAPQVLVAAPAYLECHGAPQAPGDLAGHRCLVHTGKSPTGIWRFQRDGDAFQVHVTGPFWSNFGEAIRSAALMGEGISMHPTYMVDDDIRAGRLRQVMTDFTPTELEIRAVYPRRDLPLRATLFLDHLRDWLRTEARWARSVPQAGRSHGIDLHPRPPNGGVAAAR